MAKLDIDIAQPAGAGGVSKNTGTIAAIATGASGYCH